MNKGKAHNLFTELSVPEYIALHSIAKSAPDYDLSLEKTYLKDLADRLEVSIHSVSKMVRKLKERGLVVWSHDGNGSEGTYITITELGMRSMHRQENMLNEYYSRVIEKFGHDNLIHLLQQMDALEQTMDNEFKDKGEQAYGDDTVE